MNDQRGNVSLIALAGVALAFMMFVGIARVGSAFLLRARAETAADAAALAAADQLALGHSDTAALLAARDAAADNGGRLLRCVCEGDSAEVRIELAGAAGRADADARADVDFSAALERAPSGRAG